VDVYVEADATPSNPDGVPSNALLQDVLDAIEANENGLATRRPQGAYPNVLPITRLAYRTEVIGLEVDNQAEVQANISEAIDAELRNAEPYVDGLSVPPRRDRITRAGVSGIVQNITSAAGGVFSSVRLFRGALEIDLDQLGPGQLAKSSGVDFI